MGGEHSKHGDAPPSGYTPKHLSDGVLGSPIAVEDERKQVTVLFCDIVDSSAHAARCGPEAMHASIRSR